MILFELFKAFFMIGLSAFGGGYAAMPLIQNYIVDQTHWISLLELADITSISQMTPGPILTNAATFVGLKVGSYMGAVVATLGSAFPSFILVLCFGYLLKKHGQIQFIQHIMKGLRPTIVGLIWVATLSLIFTSLFNNSLPWVEAKISVEALIAFSVCLVLSFKTKLDTLAMVIIGAGIGLVYAFITL